MTITDLRRRVAAYRCLGDTLVTRVPMVIRESRHNIRVVGAEEGAERMALALQNFIPDGKWWWHGKVLYFTKQDDLIRFKLTV